MAIYKRGKVWWMDVYVGSDRRRIRKSTGCEDETQARIVEQSAVAVNRGITTRNRAMAVIDAILPMEGRGVGIVDLCSWYKAEAEAEKSLPSKLEWQKRLGAVCRMARWMMENTRVRWAHDVDPEAAWGYSKAFGARGVTAKTRNNEIGHLRTVWAMLLKHGKASENPWEGARAIRKPEEERHGRAFTEEETERIVAASRKIGCEWEGVVTVALYTGLRKRDVECMRWDGDPDECLVADLGRGVVYGTPSKTRRRNVRVCIPMHEKVRRVLSDARKKEGRSEEFVFPWRESHPNGQRAKPGDHFFADVLKEAGITEREGEDISFHCLRHTFVTRLAEAGVAQDVRMRLAGHTEARTNDLYTHADEAARRAVEALG